MDLAGMKRRELQALCKRHGLPAGGTNADLVGRLDAVLSGPAVVEEEVAGVPARKGCLKQTGGGATEARRLRSRVIWSPVVAKTRGKSARAGTDSAAEDGISADVGADVPVRRSRRNSFNPAEAEEAGEAVAVDRKPKRKNQENDEGVAVIAQARVTRRSNLEWSATVLPPAVEKKRGRQNAAESDVQKSALVEVTARTTRSRSIVPVVVPPTVVENKRRKTGDPQTTVELTMLSDVPRSDFPATRSLRNKIVHVNNSVVDETHTTRQLENKMRPSTRRHQQVASSPEDKGQKIPATSKSPLLRWSRRNYSEANSANSVNIKLAKDSSTAQPLAHHNSHSEDLEKQPAVKEPIKRSTRKSIALAALEKEKDVIEGKNPEAHVRRSTRKSVVQVKDTKSIVEETQYANSEDVAKQPATKGPARGLRRKSVITELHEKEKSLIAEKNMETDEAILTRKPVIPVKNIKAVGEGIQIGKGKDVDKQFVVKQPTRRSSRKSVLPDMLENNSGLLAPKMNAEMNVRRSTRKSVLPDMHNEKQDHHKMARNENLQSGKYQDGEKQQKVKDSIRQSRRSIATVLLEGQNNDEGKKFKNPTRRTTHKSHALNAVEEVSMDHIEVGEEGLKLRKRSRFLLEISSSANVSWKHQNAQISNEKDNTEGSQQASNCTTSKRRSSKKRRTTAPEEVMPFKVANDDIVIMEETKDTLEYNNESSSKVQEICQVNAAREEFSSGPLLVTVAPSDEICTVQSVAVVIPGSESGDDANQSSDKSKQPQEHSVTQTVDDHLSETRSGKLDQSTCITGLVSDNCVVSEDKTLMSEDREEQSPVSGEQRVSLEANANEPEEKNLANVTSTDLHTKSLQHDIDRIAKETDKEVLAQENCNDQPVPAQTDQEIKLNDELADPDVLAQENCNDQPVPAQTDLEIKLHDELADPDHEEQSPVSGERRVSLEANANEPEEKNLANVISIDLHTKSLQHDNGRIAEETDKEHEEKYAVSPIAVEKSFRQEASAIESAGKPLTVIFSNDLHTKHLQHDCDVLIKETGEEVLAQENCNDQPVPAQTDLEIKLNDELADPDVLAQENCNDQPVPANEPEEKNLANVISTDLHTKTLQHDNDRIAEETDKDHEEQSNVFGERRVSLEANANEPEEKNLANVISTDLHTKTLQHDNDRIAEETDKDHEEQSNVSGERRVSLEANANEPEEKNLANVISTDLHTKTLQHDNDRIAEETDKDVSSLVFPIEEHEEKYAVSPIAVEKSVSREASACESAGKPLTVIFSNDLHTKHLQHDCDVLIKETGEDVLAQENCNDQPVPAQTDLEMKLNDELADPEVLAQENCNDQPVLAQTDLETKLNDELADLAMESGCSITERNEGLVAHNLDQEGFLEATPECKQECGLPEETVISSKETGSLLCADQSPIGLESLFSQESIVESVGHCALASATTHTENGFDDSKDCHNKSALENVHVPEPCSHNDTKGGIFKNVDCMHTSQRDDRMEGVPEANTDEEHVLSAFLLDANHLNVVINSEEVVCEGEDSKELLHSEDCKASSEKTDVNDGNVYGISDAVVRCALHAPADDNYEIFLGPNTDVPRQVYNDGCSDVKEDRFASKPWTIDIIEDASVKERSNLKDWQLDSKLEGTEIVESGLYFNKDIGNILHSGSIGEITPSGSGLSKDSSVDYRGEVLDGFSMEASLERSSTRGEQNGCRLDAIENPSITLATSGYKHEGALSEEAVYTKKNYAGTCLSNPRELIMELQSHFSKENINESDPHDSLVFPTAENSADEQLVKVHHGSNLSQLGLTDLLDGPIGCSNTDVLCQCDNHKNQSNEDKVEEVEAVSAAKYIESEVVLLPSQERSNLNNEQLNTKLESPNIMGSCLNCDNDVCNTSDNGSVFVIGKRTPSASGLPEDYPKDSDLQQPVLDSFSVVSSFQDNISGKKTVSGVAGSEILSLSLATPDYKHEDGFSEEAVCRTKNYTGTSSVDPRHLDMEGHSIYSEGDTYQGPCQDLGRHEEQESCMSIPMQAKESGGVLRSSHTKGSVTAAQIDLAGDAHLIVSDNAAAKQVFSEEKEETKSISSSDIDILHEKSYSSGHDDHAACAAETQFYHPQKASISDGLHLGPSSLQVESLDALDSDILYVNTGVLEQHHKEGYYEPSVYQITSGICTMSEAEPFEVLETGKDVKTPSKLDEQLNPGLDGDEAEKHSLDCGTDTSPVMSKRTLSSPGSGPCQQYVNESTTSTQSTDNHPNDLPAPRSPEQSACFQNDNDSGSAFVKAAGEEV
uniref:SAP domain-containing protein n=1 Tax=Zea mays TaxID=4577 RepID=A0A804N6Q3_MAIZE